MFCYKIYNRNFLGCFCNINAVYKQIEFNIPRHLIVRRRSHSNSTQVESVRNESHSGKDSSPLDFPPAPEVIKSFQLLRTKPRGYDDIANLRSLSIKTLGNLSFFKSHELCDISEIFAFLKYRNVLVFQGISESLYWMCKMQKVKLRDLSRFLKSCFILRYTPNTRYLDCFFEEIDNVRHVKSVGDYLRFYQFLVHSNLWMSEKYMRLYLRLQEHCTGHMGLMSHSHLASFSQTQILIDHSDQEIFDQICTNFERELEKSDPTHLRMLSNSLMSSKIKHLPLGFSRTLKYYLERRREEIPIDLAVESLSLLKRFYHRDTELLNKLGDLLAEKVDRCTTRELTMALNNLSAMSYKHKNLINAVSRLIGESRPEDMFSKFGLINGLSNLVSKVEYYNMETISSISNRSVDSMREVNQHISDCSKPEPDNSLGRMLFKEIKPRNLDQNCKAIVTTDEFVEDIKDLNENEKSVSPRKWVLRKLTGKPKIQKNNEERSENKLKYWPESTDIIKQQSLREYFQKFFHKFFEGEHPAKRRLENRNHMNIQKEKYKKGLRFESSKSISKVYLEKKYENNYNLTIRRVKYKMKYSGSRYVQPSTYYINQVKILRRSFLSSYVKMARGNKDKTNQEAYLNLSKGDSIVGKSTPVYLDTKMTIIPSESVSQLKPRTRRELKKVVRQSNRLDSMIKHLIPNNVWIPKREERGMRQLSMIDYISNTLESLSRMNIIPFHLVKEISGEFSSKCVEAAVNECYRGNNLFNLEGFLGSLNRIMSSLKLTFLTDKSGSVLRNFKEIIRSENFESLVDYYLGKEDLNLRVCNKLLGNMCRIRFYDFLKERVYQDPETALEHLNEHKNLKTIGTMTKIMRGIMKQKKIGSENNQKILDVDMLNNVVYTYWLATVTRRREGRLNDWKRPNFLNEALRTGNFCMLNTLRSLEERRCDTHDVVSYLGVVHRYLSVSGLEGDEKTAYDGRERLFVNDPEKRVEKNGDEIRDRYRKMIREYQINTNMLDNEVQLALTNKNKMIPKGYGRHLKNEVQIYNKCPLAPPLLYDFYYKYYC